MGGWTRHTGLAVALPMDNVDTDQLIPARFMSTPRAEGYGRFLMHDLRRDAGGAPLPDFPLNRCPRASILVAGRNFGSGSSREAAVYALVDAGFRAVVAPGFGDIFASNAVNNGLLPAVVSPEDAGALSEAAGESGSDATVDIEAGTVVIGDLTCRLTLDPAWKTNLAMGWDDIDLTRQNLADIAAYRDTRRRIAAWAWPAAGP